MIKRLQNWFRNITLKRKLYFVVGIMASLIIVELISLWFSVNTLSAVRAYVGGEGLWSKAQKNAVYQLRKYGRTMDPEDYQSYLEFLKVPMGDHKTLMELSKEKPDMDIARQGFLEGRNHPDDIDGMIHLFRRFHSIYYINKAIKIWGEADSKIFLLLPIGERLRAEINSENTSRKKVDAIIKEIDPINDDLTKLEDDFSYTLGEGSRWLENLVLKLLLSIVLTVEFTGLFLTISVSIAISRGINEVVRVADKVAAGNFTEKAKVFSEDEIGRLANSFNQMVDDLNKNIEGRNKAEESLKKQKELYETLVNSQSEMGEGVAITEGLKFVFANRALCEIYGYTESEILAMPTFLNLAIPEDKERIAKHLTEDPDLNSVSSYGEASIVRKDGQIINIEYSSKPIHMESKKQIVSIIRDITARKRAENKFRDLLESAPDAMVIVDKKGSIQLVNAQTEKMFGFKREDIIGKEVEILIPERFGRIHKEHRHNYSENLKVREMGTGLELYGRKQDNSEFPIEISLSPLKTEDGILVSAAIRDITDKKEANKKLQEYALKLERSNKDLEQFAYIVSHDLREPLRTVSSYIQLLEQRYKGQLDADANEFIEFAVNGIKRMDRLIIDILKYSRVGTEDKEHLLVDFTKIIDIVIATSQENIVASKATVTAGKLPALKVNELQMVQLFQNLINNALKFRGEQPPRVDISAEEKKDEWLFAVKDNGIGIDSKYSKKIFAVFQRLHSMSEYEGTGIGLAICKKIVEQHNGKIWVESEPGKGATFYFTIKK